MKWIVFKYYVVFVIVMILLSCAKVTQIQSPPVTGDTQPAIKVDTPVKTKPTVPDSSQLPKALYIKLLGVTGQPLSNVTVAIRNCILDTVPAVSITPGTCSLPGTWQTDANGIIFIDSSAYLAIPGRGLGFALSKENYWTDTTNFMFVQPGPGKVDTLIFTLYAVSWLKVHVQDSIPADSGQLELYFTPDGVSGAIVFLPAPPPSYTTFYFNTGPPSLVGYMDHLKTFGPGQDLTFIIKTTGLTTNQIFIDRNIAFYGRTTLYNETQTPNNFDTLDWEIKLQ
jgi:hypothetical protein